MGGPEGVRGLSCPPSPESLTSSAAATANAAGEGRITHGPLPEPSPPGDTEGAAPPAGIGGVPGALAAVGAALLGSGVVAREGESWRETLVPGDGGGGGGDGRPPRPDGENTVGGKCPVDPPLPACHPSNTGGGGPPQSQLAGLLPRVPPSPIVGREEGREGRSSLGRCEG
jgi:hypothetical protein